MYMDAAMNDKHVPNQLFAEFIAHFPQVCVEVVLEYDGGVLVARRTNEPVKGEWFWPGGRLNKGEQLEDAAHRIAQEELGIEIDVEEQLGVRAHFWETSDAIGRPSRHTVNVVYRASPRVDNPDIVLDEQHTEYRLLTETETSLHEYVRRYIREFELLS